MSLKPLLTGASATSSSPASIVMIWTTLVLVTSVRLFVN